MAIIFSSPVFASEGESEKNLRFSVLGGPGYTPDYGFLIGGSALMTFDMPNMEGFERRSVVPAAFSLSFGGGVSLSFVSRPQLFIKQDRIRILGEFIYANLTNNYYGVGYDTNSVVLRGDNTTEYFLSQVVINPIVLFRVRSSDWFVGALTDFKYDNVTDPAQGMVDDPDYMLIGGDQDGLKLLNNGLGVAVSYDTRDIPANAYEGVYFDFKSTTYGRGLGGEYNYSKLQLSYRQYKSLSSSKSGRILAWNVYSEHIFGDAPFTQLAMVGSPFDLRGYYKGQYRDKSTYLALAEYRHKFHVTPVDIWSKVANRMGFVAWGGIGLLGPSPVNIEGILPNYGAGLRIEVQPRMNFRLDIGHSPVDNQTLFYFNMTEAF